MHQGASHPELLLGWCRSEGESPSVCAGDCTQQALRASALGAKWWLSLNCTASLFPGCCGTPSGLQSPHVPSSQEQSTLWRVWADMHSQAHMSVSVLMCSCMLMVT